MPEVITGVLRYPRPHHAVLEETGNGASDLIMKANRVAPVRDHDVIRAARFLRSLGKLDGDALLVTGIRGQMADRSAILIIATG
jgi:hypothetical protein